MSTVPYPLSPGFLAPRTAFRLFYPLDGLSANGRPLLEGRSFCFKPDTADYRVCPYKDGRYQHELPMNHAALKSVMGNFGQVKHLLAHYAQALRDTIEDSATPVARLWRLVYMGWSAPLYNNIKSGLFDANGEDSASADLAKLCHGILTLLQHLITAGNAGYQVLQDGDTAYAYADKHELLIGVSEVCAAPPALLRNLLDYLCKLIHDTSDNSNTDLRLTCYAQQLIRFSAARWAMETVSVIYEVTRVSTWKSYAQKSNRLQQRHAFPYTSLIKSLYFERDTQFEYLILPFRSLFFFRTDASAFDAGVDELTNLAIAIERSNSFDEAHALWRAFVTVVLSIVQSLNETLASAAGCTGVRHVYRPVDLDYFFCKSIFD